MSFKSVVKKIHSGYDSRIGTAGNSLIKKALAAEKLASKSIIKENERVKIEIKKPETKDKQRFFK